MTPTDAAPLTRQLADCIGYIADAVGMAAIDVAEVETLPELRAALGAENLGLVEVADAARFAWPGYWIGILSDGTTDRAVVRYGSPAATVWPRGAGEHVVRGYVLAPFDPTLPASQPYGDAPRTAGRVTGLFLARDAAAPMEPRQVVEALAARGLAGDRYERDAGTFRGPTGYQVTLVDEAASRVVPIPAGELRRNIVTTGIDLNALVGRRFRVGEALLVGRRLCEPCRHLENLIGQPVIEPLVHRAGLRADIVTGGRIAIDDEVASLD